MEFEPETEEIVWCRAACGNNIHKACFEQWAASSRTSGDQVKCVYWCDISLFSTIPGIRIFWLILHGFFSRTLWEQEHGSMKEVMKSGWVNDEGYYNVGEELGLPEERGRTTIPLYRTRSTSRSILAKNHPLTFRWRTNRLTGRFGSDRLLHISSFLGAPTIFSLLLAR